MIEYSELGISEQLGIPEKSVKRFLDVMSNICKYEVLDVFEDFETGVTVRFGLDGEGCFHALSDNGVPDIFHVSLVEADEGYVECIADAFDFIKLTEQWAFFEKERLAGFFNILSDIFGYRFERPVAKFTMSGFYFNFIVEKGAFFPPQLDVVFFRCLNDGSVSVHCFVGYSDAVSIVEDEDELREKVKGFTPEEDSNIFIFPFNPNTPLS